MSRTFAAFVSVGALAVAAVVAFSVAMPTAPATTPLAERPRKAETVGSVAYFYAVDAMTRESHLVIEGTITEVSVVGAIGTDEHTTDRTHVTMEVETVLSGRSDARQVTIEEDGIASAYSQVGDAGIYFLVQRQDREPGSFRLINYQGRYLEDEQGRLQDSGINDELMASVEALSVEELRDQVLAATRR